MDTKFPHVSGMRDILSSDHEYFTFIKKVVRYHARRSGFRRISLPALSDFELLKTALGEASDLVSHALYKMVNEEGVFALRPEYAASMARAYVEHNLHEKPQPVEFYYIDQNWQRALPEREAEGVLSEKHTFGFEILGEEDPALDAQLIEMSAKIFSDLGLNVKLRLNNIGTRNAQDKYREDLRNFFAGKERNLGEDDVSKLAVNPLHVLTSKNEDTQILVQIAPSIASSLDKESKEHFAKVQEYLDVLGIEAVIDDKLFGGLDYYRRLYFEFYIEHEGQETILGCGGRYDDLVEEFGGVKTPALTFSADMDAVATAMRRVQLAVPSKDKVSIFVVQLGDSAKKMALRLVSDLRARGIRTMGALGKASIRSQLESASKFEVEYALVLGQMEVVEKKIIMRDMKKGTQETLPFEGVVDRMVELLDPSLLDTKDFRAMIEDASDSDEG
ncbi:histidine--tRNA ligase [Candidatus Gracilibacteria bacterium CG17_big_fil_post_rev_8_21_14_2_50_48_13]|nr:MAG: histidine--tRNA ligase [Candidatus Gracilibacteria bacterium CG17_big_fil_post_rev_8_21_14_2_50_48_13]